MLENYVKPIRINGLYSLMSIWCDMLAAEYSRIHTDWHDYDVSMVNRELSELAAVEVWL